MKNYKVKYVFKESYFLNFIAQIKKKLLFKPIRTMCHLKQTLFLPFLIIHNKNNIEKILKNL